MYNDIIDINNLIVVKHNRIIEAEYSMGVCEQRILLTCISKIDSSKSMNENRIFSVSVDDIVDLVNVERSSAYPHLKKTCKILFTNTITVYLSDSPDPLVTRWVDAVRYIEREGRIELRFTPEMIPFLTQLSRDFTKYKLSHVLKFKSAYSYRLYEWLCCWGRSEHVVAVDWIREKFQLIDKYPKMADFKKDVIDVAVKEISATSDIKVTYEQIKKGRNIVAFRFIYTRTPDKKLPKGESEPLAISTQRSQPEKSEIAGGINFDFSQFNDKDKQLAQNALAKVPEATQRIILDMFKSALAKGDVKYPLRYLNSLVSKSLSGDLDTTAFDNVPAPSNKTRRADIIKQAFAKNTDEIKAELASEGFVFIKGEGSISKSEFEVLGLIEKAPRKEGKSISLAELMAQAEEKEKLRQEQALAQKQAQREREVKQPKTVADIPIAPMSEKEIAARQKILELEAQLIAAGEFVGINEKAISEDELAGLAELEAMQTNLLKNVDKK
jgi:plasmid replication initiation protein